MVNAYLMIDMAHFSGLVAAELLQNPFDFADIVTTTTHKTLRGPRSGMIFINKKTDNGSLVTKVNEAVFPGLQGGPHNHQIAGVAFQMKQIKTPEFKDYITKVRDMAQFLAIELMTRGFDIVTEGTDNHIVLVNLKNKNLTGSKMEYLCELVDISLNKNCIIGDKNAMSPSGIRIGTPAMVTRGFDKEEFIKVVDFLCQLSDIAKEIQTQNENGKLLAEFKKITIKNIIIKEKIQKIKDEVNELALKFPFYLM
jgi:glycine hydroxymethyltransferase